MKWIPRASMPQVNQSDYANLVLFLEGKGVKVSAVDVVPMYLHFHQQVNWSHLKGATLPPEVLSDPILIASDNGILDGNHRAAYRRLNGYTTCPALQLSVPFDVALSLLFQFSGTYKESSLHIAA